jgi:carboxyl-terminal processing protease
MRLLIHYIRAIGLCLSLCFTNLAVKAQDQTKSAKLSLHDRGWIATQIYSAITTYFGHWRAVPELDLDKEFQSYLDQILATDDRRAFDLASMELIAKLRNGHSGFRDNWLIDNDGQMLGFYACQSTNRGS